MASNLVTGWPPIINREAVTCPQHSRILRVTGRTNASWQYTSKLRPLTGLLLVLCDDIGMQIPAAYSGKVLSMPKTCLRANRTRMHTCGQVRPRSVWRPAPKGLTGALRLHTQRQNSYGATRSPYGPREWTFNFCWGQLMNSTYGAQEGDVTRGIREILNSQDFM